MRKTNKRTVLRAGLYVSLCASLLLSSCAKADDKETTEAEITTQAASAVTTTEAATKPSEEATTEAATEVATEAKTEPVTEEETTKEVIVVDRNWTNNADISWIDLDKPMVALSFDDGPVGIADTATSIRIQNALRDNGMHATFFYWGNSMNATTKQELVRAYELGFELGNHTWTHPFLSKKTEAEITEEVAKIDKVLRSITGNEEDRFLLRPPYLDVNQKVKDTINVPLISCGYDSKDWDNATTQQIIDGIVAAAENGTLDGKIVLMHETYKTTAEAVEYLVPYLKEKGYQVVTISELFKARGKEMKAGIVYTYCNK